MPENNLNSKDLEKLIDQVSARLSVPRENIVKMLQNGDLNAMLDKKSVGKIQKILSNKEATDKILNNPSAQAIIKKLKENG